MKQVLVFGLFLFLVGCKSSTSDGGQPDVAAESIAAETETWIRSCSPIDDVITSEILDDAGLLPAWWVERLEIAENKIIVTRSVYVDEICETPLTLDGENGLVVQCFGHNQERVLVQGTYDVLSFPYIDDIGDPDIPESCGLASEPGMNVYPVGDLLYRAFYSDAMSSNPSELVVDFNKVFERVE